MTRRWTRHPDTGRAVRSPQPCLHPTVSSEEGTDGVPYRYCTSCGHIFEDDEGEAS